MNTGHYAGDRERSDKTLDVARDFLIPAMGLTGFRYATFLEDTRQATDAVITKDGRDKTIGLRMRGNYYYTRYPYDITIRCYADGTGREWDKIVSGLGDFLFYYFMDASNTRIVGYTLVSLNKIRKALPECKRTIKYNKSDNTYFYAIDIRQFQDGYTHEDIE